MKQVLHLCSKIRGYFSASQSNDVGYDCRLTVVRPSSDCRSAWLKLCSVLAILLTIGVGNVWGATLTYTHDFTAKPTENADNTLSTITWTVSNTTNLNGYNSKNYKGVQFGTGSKTGSITLTSKNAWGAQTSTSYYGYTNVKKVYVWLNKGGGDVTPTVSVGGTAATSDGTTVTKNSSATSQRNGTTKVTFTPASDHTTGVIVITCNSTEAGYLCSIQVECEEPGGGCDNTVTLNTGSATNGTISYASSVATCSATDDDRNVTISVAPSSGYTLLSSTRLTFNKTSGTATASYVNGPTWNGSTNKYEYIYRFARNDKGAGSFSVTCDAIPRYTVSFNTGTSNPTQANIQEASAGSGITLPAGPTPTCSGDGWSFAGWKETSAVTSETTVAPTLLSAGSTFHPTGNVTLYAVYSNGNFTKITNTSEITNGGKYIVVAYYGSKNYVMTNSYNSTTHKLAGTQIDETSSNTYSLASISSAYCIITETGYHSGYWYIRDCYNSSSSNYLDTYYESAWYGHAKDEYDDYEFDYSGGYWSITNKWGSYPNLGFDGASTSFICSASNSHPLLLYKLTATYFSNPTCCTPLGTINGSFKLSSHLTPLYLFIEPQESHMTNIGVASD